MTNLTGLLDKVEEPLGALEILFGHTCINSETNEPYPQAEEAYMTVKAALQAQAAPTPPAQEWQPIETAPRDGTRILLAAIGNSDKYCFKKKTHIQDPTLRVWWASTGSWSDEFNKFWDGLESSGFANLSHWMPLPQPPKGGE